MSPPIALQRPDSSRCIILRSCIADEGSHSPPSLGGAEEGIFVCFYFLTNRCSIPLQFGFVMLLLWHLFCFLI